MPRDQKGVKPTIRKDDFGRVEKNKYSLKQKYIKPDYPEPAKPEDFPLPNLSNDPPEL